MKYRLNRQGYGSLETPEPELVTKELLIEIPAEEAEGCTVKLVSDAPDSPFYARVVDGVCLFPRRALKGYIGLSVISDKGARTCTPLVAIEATEGVVVVPDARDVLTRLARIEREVSDAVAVHHDLLKKYEDLEKRISHLFDGYNF